MGGKLDKMKSKNNTRRDKHATIGEIQEILNHTWPLQELLFIFFLKRGEGNYEDSSYVKEKT